MILTIAIISLNNFNRLALVMDNSFLYEVGTKFLYVT
jgi:ABC-type microcin C transport system permease subunit YejB